MISFFFQGGVGKKNLILHQGTFLWCCSFLNRSFDITKFRWHHKVQPGQYFREIIKYQPPLCRTKKRELHFPAPAGLDSDSCAQRKTIWHRNRKGKSRAAEIRWIDDLLSLAFLLISHTHAEKKKSSSLVFLCMFMFFAKERSHETHLQQFTRYIRVFCVYLCESFWGCVAALSLLHSGKTKQKTKKKALCGTVCSQVQPYQGVRGTAVFEHPNPRPSFFRPSIARRSCNFPHNDCPRSVLRTNLNSATTGERQQEASV